MLVYAANAIVSQPLSVINTCRTCNTKYFIVKESISPTQAVVLSKQLGLRDFHFLIFLIAFTL